MKRVIALLVIVLSVFFISAQLDMSYNDSQNVTKGDEFVFLMNVTCSSSACEDNISIIIPGREEVNYSHPDGSNDTDCFGGTCLSMPVVKGAVYNVSGASNWGCGECSNVSTWVGGVMNNLGKNGNCFSGMADNILGAKLCLEVDNGEKWDIVFSGWSSAGSSYFAYTRSITNNIFYDLGFTINKDVHVVSLAENETAKANFKIGTSSVDVGSYNLTIRSNDYDSMLNLDVLAVEVADNESEENETVVDEENETVVEEDDNHHSSKKRYIIEEDLPMVEQAYSYIVDEGYDIDLRKVVTKDNKIRYILFYESLAILALFMSILFLLKRR